MVLLALLQLEKASGEFSLPKVKLGEAIAHGYEIDEIDDRRGHELGATPGPEGSLSADFMEQCGTACPSL